MIHHVHITPNLTRYCSSMFLSSPVFEAAAMACIPSCHTVIRVVSSDVVNPQVLMTLAIEIERCPSPPQRRMKRPRPPMMTCLTIDIPVDSPQAALLVRVPSEVNALPLSTAMNLCCFCLFHALTTLKTHLLCARRRTLCEV